MSVGSARKLFDTPHRAFALGLGFVAGLAKDLQVGFIIRATLGNIDNVV